MVSSAIWDRVEKLWPTSPDAVELVPLKRIWPERFDTPFPADAQGWRDALESAEDGELSAIACLRDSALQAAEAKVGLQGSSAQLLVALLLLAFERHVRRHVDASVELEGLSLKLQSITEPLAAQVVAACISGQGLLLIASPEGGEPEAEAANVIQGLPPEVLMQRDGKQAVRMEVDIALRAMRVVPSGGGLKQRRAAARQQVTSARTDAAINLDVKAFLRRWNTGLFFLVPEAQAPAALRDPEVCAYAAQSLGVRVFRHGASDGGQQSAHDPDWDGVVANVAQPLREAISHLFPRAAAPSMTTKASAAAPQVFVSYAHADDRQLVKQVQDTLSALVQHGHIRMWIDEHNIRTGQDFHPDIQAGVDASQVALVLVSKHLLKSAYVTRYELPHILKRRDQGHLTFCPFMLCGCDHQASPHFEMTNFKLGIEPLEGMVPGDQSSRLAQLSVWLRSHLNGQAL